MTQKSALAIVIPVLEKTIIHMKLANKTPEQVVKLNRLKKAVKVLKSELEGDK